MSLSDHVKPNRKFFPSSTYFDHLYSEYQSLNLPFPADNKDKILLDGIKARRDNLALTRENRFSWDDIYTFELTVLKYLPINMLRNKVISLRAMYLNIFGQDKYKTYLDASFPDPSKASESELLSDAQYLLHQIYLSLGALSSRDGLGKWLTQWAAYLVILLGIFAVLLFLANRFWLKGVPVKVALLAGALGGLLSILHRLQSIPSEGDPIFSLATFWHGAYALFVSPLTGAIFAVLLYLMFAAGILEGRFFPDVVTPVGADMASVAGVESEDCGEMTTIKSRAQTRPSQSQETTGSNSNAANTSAGTTPGGRTGNSSTAGNTSTGNTPGAGNISASNSTTGNNATNTSATGNTSMTENTALPPNTSGAANTTANTNTSVTGNSSSSASSTGNNATRNSTATGNSSNTAARGNVNAAAQPSVSPVPTATSTPVGSTGFSRFLRCSGPASGYDYAMLIIWCFLAGFAERLVPDTLNRLVDEGGKTQVKKQ
jgi:hypothetical protein